MKKFIFILATSITLVSHAQEKRKTFAVNYGFGNGSLFTFTQMDGGGSHEGGKSLTNFGVYYSYELQPKNLFLETGINYMVYKNSTSSYLPPNPMTWNYTKNWISLPVRLRYEIGKYIFVNGGLNLDIDVSKKRSREMSGIGAGIGVGAQYYFKDKFGIYVNPQFDLRNLATFSESSYRLSATTVAFGMAYRFR